MKLVDWAKVKISYDKQVSGTIDFIKKYIKVNAIKKNDNQGYWAIKMLLKAWKEENGKTD